MARLTYVYDPLCGWCFGFVPTLRQFAKANPAIEIDVVPEGSLQVTASVPTAIC